MTTAEIRARDKAAVDAVGFGEVWRELLAEDTPTTRMLASMLAAVAIYFREKRVQGAP